MNARENVGLAGLAYLAVGLIMLALGVTNLDSIDWRWFGGCAGSFTGALAMFAIYRQRPAWLEGTS